jgi:hypothetical protein
MKTKIVISTLLLIILLTLPLNYQKDLHAGMLASSESHTVGVLSFFPYDVEYFNSDVPVAWFNLAYDLVQAEQISPPVAARIFGYLGIALYEALVPGMPGYQSLVGQLNGLQVMPEPADHVYHWPTVANSVLATTLLGLLNSDLNSTQSAIHALKEEFNQAFKPSLPPGVFTRSLHHGFTVGHGILIWAGMDGYEFFNDCDYMPPEGDGMWVTTPPTLSPALQPCWGKLRPFVLSQSSDCSPTPPPSYSELPEADFYQEALEVFQVVNNLTPEQLEIAMFWADNPGETGTPAGHSISILNQILIQEESSLDTASEAFARVGISLADSFIACWETKYEYNLLRPVTYIHQVLGYEDWTTPVVTPPFPEYTSGHSVQSGAVAQVLTDMFGEMAFTDNTHASRGFASRNFENFLDFAQESAISRLYGGIHFRSAIELGLEQGQCIGEKVNQIMFNK